MQTFAVSFATRGKITMIHESYHEIPHRRFNQLTGEWVLVSPHRSHRPWDGQQEQLAEDSLPTYSSDCYLCPTNLRANGERNPDYRDTFVFTNDFSALLPAPSEVSRFDDDELLRAEPEAGLCRVICYSPRHDLTIPRMSRKEVEQIVSTWVSEYQQLAVAEGINYVQIFENRGLVMGCSNPHPHGQVWANETIPVIPARENLHQEQHYRTKKSCLLCDYLKKELKEQQRIVLENEGFVVLIPFWAVWPFETLVIPRHHCSSIASLSPVQIECLAEIMIALGIRYDNLFKTSFPYSMGIHQQPCDSGDYPHWHYHLHYLPPLLRSPTIKKHMVGYEMLAMAQRDITPEQAAHTLRSLSSTHYLDES